MGAWNTLGNAAVDWDKVEWIGVPEECDCCHEEYPMIWIEFTGRQFLCLACRTEPPSPPKSNQSNTE